MNYRVLYTPQKMSEAQFTAIKDKLFPRIYNDRNDALAWCRDVNKKGGISWSIEADDGSHLNRRQIVDEASRRTYDLIGRPKNFG